MVVLFNAIVVALWTITLLPQWIEERRWVAIAGGLLVVVVVDWRLYADRYDFPHDLAGGVMIGMLSGLGGLLMHRYSGNFRR